MVFDLDRQALVAGIKRGSSGYGPGFENTVKFETQIVMQSRRSMFLNNEAQLRGLWPVRAFGSCVFSKSRFFL